MDYLKITTISIMLLGVLTMKGCYTDDNKVESSFKIELKETNKYEEPLLWGYNCKVDYNKDFCPNSKEYYNNNYNIQF